MLNISKKDRIYIWMSLFILLINFMNLGVQPKEIPKKDSISNKTFKELSLQEGTIKKVLEENKPLARLVRTGFTIGLMLLLLGIVLNLRFFHKDVKDKLAYTQRTKFDIRWDILDVIRVSILIVFSGYVLYFFELFFARYFNLSKLDTNLRLILNTTIMDLIGIFAISYFVFIKYKHRPIDLGLTFKNFIRNIFAGIVGYIAILPTLLVILLVVLWGLNLIKYEPPPQPIFDLLFEEKRHRVILFLGIFISLFGPIIEEIFFRGFLYNAIKKRFGIKPGVLISAALFSLLHSNLVGFLPIMALGALLAYLYETTGSIVSSIVVHIIHNSLILGLVFFIKSILG